MDAFKRAATGLAVAGWVLFIGYMCGAPITEPNWANAMPYMLATLFGGLAWIQPWRLGE